MLSWMCVTATRAPVRPSMSGDVDRQVPLGSETFLDHVGYFVADLDRAGAALGRLGFQISPTKVHTNDTAGELVPSGTSNRLARLRRGFLEVLAATGDTPLADQLRAALARYEGLHLVALSHDDLDAQRDRLEADGFATAPRVTLRNTKHIGDAPRTEVWSVLRLQPGGMPEGRIQFVRSHTPDVSWHPGSTEHPNGADSLTAIWLCVADLAAATERYRRFAGRPHRPPAGPTAVIGLDRGRLILSAPEALQTHVPVVIQDLPFMAAAAVRADLDTTRAALRANDVTPLRDDGHLIWIAPGDALGALLVFHDAEARLPWDGCPTS